MSNQEAVPLPDSGSRAPLFEATLRGSPRLRLRLAQGFSAMCHGLILFVITLHVNRLPPKPAPPQKKLPKVQIDRIKLLFAPERKKNPAPNQRPAIQAPRIVPPAAPKTLQPDDPKRLRIDFSPDPAGEQVRALTQRLGGDFAFASPESVKECQESLAHPGAAPRCFYQMRVSSQDWNLNQGNYSLQGYFVVSIGPPDPPYVKALRARLGIPQRYTLFGLLPESFREDVEDRVHDEAEKLSLPANSVVTGVEVTFADVDPQGFRMRILSIVTEQRTPGRAVR